MIFHSGYYRKAVQCCAVCKRNNVGRTGSFVISFLQQYRYIVAVQSLVQRGCKTLANFVLNDLRLDGPKNLTTMKLAMDKDILILG